MAAIISPLFKWSELLQILSFLSDRDIVALGSVSHAGYVHVLLREKNSRQYKNVSSISRRFLSQGLGQEKVLLVSYPRCGNSLLRRLLEERTGIVTGSDSRTNRSLSASLLRCGYRGEGIVDSSVWVVKSHYPERMGYLKFPAHRIVLVVRNPFDAIESYFQLGMTNTHDRQLTDESFQGLKQLYEECILNEANVWRKFHEFWLDEIDHNVPLTTIRYEDLTGSNRQVHVDRVLQFLYAGRPPMGYQRYRSASSKEAPAESNTGYRVKQGGVGKALNRMSIESALYIQKQTQPLLDRFGYVLIQPTSNRIESLPKLKLEVNEVDPVTKGDSGTAGFSVGNGLHVVVNEAFSIRAKDDRFGRYFTTLRKSLTENDERPFPLL